MEDDHAHRQPRDVRDRVAGRQADAERRQHLQREGHWDAHCDLGKRHVDNHSDTTFTIKDGKIIGQRDDWDLHAWTQQALPIGRGSAALDRGISFAAHSLVELKAHFDPLAILALGIAGGALFVLADSLLARRRFAGAKIP